MWRRSTARTATTSPRAASKAWRGPCARRWRWTRGRRAAFPPPRERSRTNEETPWSTPGRCVRDDDMSTFTLHLPRDARPGDTAALDEAELVKDAFSWGAFFFTFFWFFAHRLWLAGLAVLAILL